MLRGQAKMGEDGVLAEYPPKACRILNKFKELDHPRLKAF